MTDRFFRPKRFSSFSTPRRTSGIELCNRVVSELNLTAGNAPRLVHDALFFAGHAVQADHRAAATLVANPTGAPSSLHTVVTTRIRRLNNRQNSFSLSPPPQALISQQTTSVGDRLGGVVRVFWVGREKYLDFDFGVQRDLTWFPRRFGFTYNYVGVRRVREYREISTGKRRRRSSL